MFLSSKSIARKPKCPLDCGWISYTSAFTLHSIELYIMQIFLETM